MKLYQAWRVLFLICIAFVTWLSLVPPAELPPVTIWDKLAHAIAFAVLAFLAVFAWPITTGLRLFLGLMVYGLLIEIAQLYLPLREFSPEDMIANAVGAIAGIILAIKFPRLNR